MSGGRLFSNQCRPWSFTDVHLAFGSSTLPPQMIWTPLDFHHLIESDEKWYAISY